VNAAGYNHLPTISCIDFAEDNPSFQPIPTASMEVQHSLGRRLSGSVKETDPRKRSARKDKDYQLSVIDKGKG
jgi:hypothetical protein